MQGRARQDETILFSRGFLVGREVLARFDVRWRHDTVDAFTVDKSVQELPDGAARGENRSHTAAEAVSDPGYIDTAATGIALWRRTAHFPRRLNTADIDENVDGRIDRERDNIGHVLVSGTGLYRTK
jgi:hypothetical protein